MPYEKNKLQQPWISDPFGLNQAAVEWAKEFGEFLAVKGGSYISSNGREEIAYEKALTTSQLRKFFGQIKRIQAEGYSAENRQELRMIAPQLAYAVGRNIKNNKDETKIRYFQESVDKALKFVFVSDDEFKDDPDKAVADERKRFKNFVNLVEAIVAYHKSKGGE